MSYPFDLRRVKNRQELLSALGIDHQSLDVVINFTPPPRHVGEESGPLASGIIELDLPPFLRHDIPKRNKSRGYRTVWEPTFLKNEYKALARRLDSFFRLSIPGYPHDCSYGYVSGRNIRENAMAHTGHKELLSLDITNFFPSIIVSGVEQLFTSLGVNPGVSGLLSRFITIGGALPLGLPTSPTISNAIALPIDIELEALAAKAGATYTRYSDDLSFSSNGELPDVEAIGSCLAASGFELAGAKTRRSKIGQAHYVTGLSISDPQQPHVPRRKKRALRQELYYARKFGLDDHFGHLGINDSTFIQMEVNRIDGMLKFVTHHEKRMAPKFKADWAQILRDCNMGPSFSPKNQHREPFHIFVDEAEFERSGQQIVALAMAVSQHAEQIVSESRAVLAEELGDLWAAGNVQAIEKKGLHFADATEDLRLKYVKRLSAMPFEGYVAFAVNGSPTDYQKTYLRLLSALVSRRLMAAESKFAHFYFEKNDKVSQKAVRACVQCAYDELKQSNDRHPLGIGIEFVSKPNMAVSVPDFMLGVLGKYIQSKPAPSGNPETRERLMFERLRDKYRLILDVDNWTEFSRRRPILPWRDA